MVMLGVLIVHSAQTGGLVARLQDRFARNIDLRVQDITIVGRANTPEPLLRAALGVSVGDPILGFSVEAARARIETLSWVGHVAVERRLPGTIYLALTERRPFAIWQDQGKFQLIDHDGAVVLNEDVANFTDLPLVVGDARPDRHAARLKNPGGRSHPRR
jgi:cell division protein FtsQ